MLNRRRVLSLLWCIVFVLPLVVGVGPGRAQGSIVVQLGSVDVGVAESAVLEGRITCPANGCGGFKVTISFDRALVRVESAQVGPYLGSQVFEAENTVDNAAGQVRLVAAAMAPPPGLSDVLFALNVSGLIPGTAAFNIDALEITDLAGNPVGSSGQGGVVNVFETGKIPFFSPPDNRWEVAFTSERDGNPEIYAVNADGSNPRRLTNNPALDGSPTWSPAGDQIAFFSTRDGNAEIYVMNADGSNVRRLTNNPAPDSYPAWSPDGSRIAFVSERDGNSEIYVMNADGSNPQRLTNEAAVDSYPAWSPRGDEIAFVSARGGAAEVYLMNQDGSNQRAITSLFGANGWYPAWAPGASEMSFTTERDGQADIYRMNATGADVVRLTEKSGWLTTTDWSPDGQWIAFSAGLTGFSDLYVMDREGQYWFRMTELQAEDYDPDWRPVRSQFPCSIRTDRQDVPVRVGPGLNRGEFTFLPPNQDFRVEGQALDDEGKIWWKLDKDQIPGGEMANTLWVAEEDVEELGDCASVPPADVPPIIPFSTPTPPPPPPTQPPPPGVTPPPVITLPPPITLEPQCYTLTLTWSSGGSAYRVTQPNCGRRQYLLGTGVTIQAVPQGGGYYVQSWSGTCGNIPSPGYLVQTATVTVNGNCSVHITFSYLG